MSPDARLIAGAILLSQERFPKGEHPAPVIGGCANAVLALEVALGDPVKGQPGIRGMVPVAYLKDILAGIIGRLEALDYVTKWTSLDAERAYRELEGYAKRRLADAENL